MSDAFTPRALASVTPKKKPITVWEAADRIEALEAKLAGGVIAEYDDGSTVFLSGYAGGAADGGAWSTLTLMERAPDGTLRERKYKAQGDWCATLAEIKAT
jgi:hypothetical protein